MAVGKIMKSGGMAALAAALAVVALPANAQERGGAGRWGGGSRGGDAPAAQSDGGNARGSNWNHRGGEDNGGGRGMGWRQGGQAQAQAPVQTTPAPQPQVAQRQAPQAQVPQVQNERRNWGGNGSWQGRPSGVVEGRPNVANDNAARWRNNGNGGGGVDRWRSDSTSANRWRNDDANRWRSDTANANRWRNDDNRGRGNNDSAWRGDRQNWAGAWNRDWRRDNRYDWRGYRNANRDRYRLGAYYAPYRNYSYRRLNSGFILDAMFFGSRYWINDPWQYRLPPADGPFRWVRYYDDALLVDTYTGEVVDVINDFFW